MVEAAGVEPASEDIQHQSVYIRSLCFAFNASTLPKAGSCERESGKGFASDRPDSSHQLSCLATPLPAPQEKAGETMASYAAIAYS